MSGESNGDGLVQMTFLPPPDELGTRQPKAAAPAASQSSPAPQEALTDAFRRRRSAEKFQGTQSGA